MKHTNKRRLILGKTVLIVLPFLIVLILLSLETNKQEQQEFRLKPRVKYPNEWMYSQRAYPDNYINKSAIQEAIEQTKAIKSSRSTNDDNSEWSLVGPINTGGRITDLAI